MSHEQPDASTTPRRLTFSGPASPSRPSIGARAVPLHIPSSPTRMVHSTAPAAHQPTVRPSTDSDRTLGQHTAKSYPENESRSSDLERPPTTPLGTPAMMYKPRLSTSSNASNGVGSRARPANLRIRVQPRFPSSPGHSPTANAFPSQPSSAYASQPSSAIGPGSVPSSLTGSGLSTPATFSRSPSPDSPLPSAIPFPMLEVEPLCSCFDTQCSCGSNANTPVTAVFPSLTTIPSVANHTGFPLQPSSHSLVSTTEPPRPGPRSTPVSPLAVSKPLPLLPVATKSPKKSKRPSTSREGEGNSSAFGSRIFSKILKPSKSAHELQNYSQNPAHRSTPTHKLSSPPSPNDKRTSKTKRTSKGTSPGPDVAGGHSIPSPIPTRQRAGTEASYKDIETNTRLADIDFTKTGLASASVKLAEMQALGVGLGLRGPMSASVLPLPGDGPLTSARERSFSASATSLRSSAQASPRSTTGSLAEKVNAAAVNARFDHLPPSPLLHQAMATSGPSSPKFPEKVPEAVKPSKLADLLDDSELPSELAPPPVPIGAEAALPSTAVGSVQVHQQMNSAPPSPSGSVKRIPKSQSKSRMRSPSVSTSQGGNHSRPPSRLQSPAQSRVHSPIQSLRALPSSSQVRLDSPLHVQFTSDGANGSMSSLAAAKFALLEIESKDESSASGSHDHSFYQHDAIPNSPRHLPTEPGSTRTSFESSHPVAAQVLSAAPARTMSRWERVRARVDSLGAGLRGRKLSRVSQASQVEHDGGERVDTGAMAGGHTIQATSPVRERRSSNASQREKAEPVDDEMPTDTRRSASKPRSKPRISSSRSRKSSMVAIHPQLPAHPEAPMPSLPDVDAVVISDPQEEAEHQIDSIPEAPIAETLATAEGSPFEDPVVTPHHVGTTGVVPTEHPPTPTTPQNTLFSEVVDLTQTPRNLAIRTSVRSLARHISITPATPEAIAFPSMSFSPEDPSPTIPEPLAEPPQPTISAPTFSSSLNSPSSASASSSPQFATYNLGVDSDDLFSPFDSQLHTPLDLQLHLPITEESNEEADICEDVSDVVSLPSSPSRLTFKLPPPPPKRYDALTSYVMQTVPGWEPEMLMWEQRLDDPLYYAPSTNEAEPEKEKEQNKSPRATPRSSLAGSRVSRSSISSQEIKSRVMGTSIAHSPTSPISSPRESISSPSKEIDNDETIRARRRGRAHTLIGAVTRSVANSASAINLLTPTSSSPMPISSPTYYSPMRRPRTSTGSGHSILANSGLHPLEALQREPEMSAPKHLTPAFGDTRSARTHSFSSVATGSSSVSNRFKRFLDKVTARDRH